MEALSGWEDSVGEFDPFVWLQVFDMSGKEGGDVGSEISGGAMDAALQLPAGEFSEPAFHLIDPWRRCRCEVGMQAGPACQAGLDRRRVANGAVVHHETDVWRIGHGGNALVRQPELCLSNFGRGGERDIVHWCARLQSLAFEQG